MVKITIRINQPSQKFISVTYRSIQIITIDMLFLFASYNIKPFLESKFILMCFSTDIISSACTMISIIGNFHSQPIGILTQIIYNFLIGSCNITSLSSTIAKPQTIKIWFNRKINIKTKITFIRSYGKICLFECFYSFLLFIKITNCLGKISRLSSWTFWLI